MTSPARTPVELDPLEVLAGVRGAFRSLHGIVELEDVVRQGCRAIATAADFDRVVLFRIDGGDLVAHADVVQSARADAEESRPPPHRGRATGAAAEVLRRRCAALIDGDRPEETGLGDFAPSTPCVIVPVASNVTSIALMYADRSLTGRPLDLADRDLLATFAEGFGFAIERAALFERLQEQRRHFRRLAVTGQAVMAELAETPVQLSCPEEQSPFWEVMPTDGRLLGTADGVKLLSPREHEVMEHLAHGARNRDIATALVVSEETVKWHVSRILRKLHAGNRAEAVSRYLRLVAQAG